MFYKEGDDLTFTSNITHKIKTKNEIPIYSKMYKYPEIHTQEVDRQIKDMLRQNIIAPSSSPYNSPLWVVPKKDEPNGNKQWRIVIDYRKLNEITIDDGYAINGSDEIFDKLGKCNHFSVID